MSGEKCFDVLEKIFMPKRKQIVDEIYIVDEQDNVLGVINTNYNNTIQFVKPKQFIKDLNTYAVEFNHELYTE